MYTENKLKTETKRISSTFIQMLQKQKSNKNKTIEIYCYKILRLFGFFFQNYSLRNIATSIF